MRTTIDMLQFMNAVEADMRNDPDNAEEIYRLHVLDLVGEVTGLGPQTATAIVENAGADVLDFVKSEATSASIAALMNKLGLSDTITYRSILTLGLVQLSGADQLNRASTRSRFARSCRKAKPQA